MLTIMPLGSNEFLDISDTSMLGGYQNSIESASFPLSSDMGSSLLDITSAFEEICSETKDKPYLTILIEPINKLRFRYLSEKASHGVITGIKTEQTDCKKTHPTVKLENFVNSKKKNIVIKASLYTDNAIPELHVLELTGKSCKGGACYEKLGKDFTAKFSSMRVLNKKKEEVVAILMERKIKKLGRPMTATQRKKFEKEYQETVQQEAKHLNLNCCRICFEAFYEDDLYTPLFPGVFSQPVYNQRDLKIHRLSSCCGKPSGGDEIILLCDKVKKEDVQVRFFETDENGVLIWEGFGGFTKADVHYQVAITFKTPPYRENVEKCVKVELMRATNGEKSEPREFRYIPVDNELPRKRKKVNPVQDVIVTPITPENSPQGCSVYDINASDLEPIAGEYAAMEDGSVILDLDLPFDQLPITNFDYDDFFECFQSPGFDSMIETSDQISDVETDAVAIQMSSLSLSSERKIFSPVQDEKGNCLLHLLSDVNLSGKLNLIKRILDMVSENTVNLQNSSKDTPLHVACRRNRWQFLKLLLFYGGNPNIQNQYGDTPLHVAVKNNAVNCMKELLSQFLSQRKWKYCPDLNLLNYDGLAPLHIGVLNNFKESVDLLLHAKADVNVKDAKCGRTPLHFASESDSLLELLLSQPNIDIHALDFRGYSPHGLAECKENVSVILNETNMHNDMKAAHQDGACDIEGDVSVSRILKSQLETSKTEENQKSEKDVEDLAISILNDAVVEKKLCHFLDSGKDWRTLGMYLGIEETVLDCIDRFESNSSPTKALLKLFKSNCKENFTEILINTMEIAGLEEALKVLKANSVE